MASCFQHVGHITDNEDDKLLISFPPEPFFTHPLAEACTKQLRVKTLYCGPPLHHHTHDFVLTVDKNICVVVGEAKSGKDFRKELDKCLTGMCKSLQFMNYSVGVTSSERRCSVHLGYTAVRSVHSWQWTQCLKVDSVTVCKGFGESEYGGYIDKILDALVVCLSILVNSDGLLLTPQEHFMHPGTLLVGYSRKCRKCMRSGNKAIGINNITGHSPNISRCLTQRTWFSPFYPCMLCVWRNVWKGFIQKTKILLEMIHLLQVRK